MVCPTRGELFQNLNCWQTLASHARSMSHHRLRNALGRVGVTHFQQILRKSVESAGVCCVEFWATDPETERESLKWNLEATSREARRFHHHDVVECFSIQIHERFGPLHIDLRCEHQ